MDTTMNITNTDLRPGLGGARRATHAIRPDWLPRALFVTELLDRRPRARRPRRLPRRACADHAVATWGRPCSFAPIAAANEVEAFLRMRGGEIALIDAGARPRLGRGRRRDARRPRRRSVRRPSRAALATAKPPCRTRASISFWMRGEWAATCATVEIRRRLVRRDRRQLLRPVRAALEQLIAAARARTGPPDPVAGEPGTGKSHALRALVRAWAPWCSAHFIMDPEELLGQGGAYMLDVLTWDGADEDRWRLLILEDAGELITADARAITGQALSRLLNVDRRSARAGHPDDAADHDQRTGRTPPPGDSAAGSLPGRHRVHAALARGGERLAGGARRHSPRRSAHAAGRAVRRGRATGRSRRSRPCRRSASPGRWTSGRTLTGRLDRATSWSSTL